MHAKIHAQTIPLLLSNKELNPAPQQIKGVFQAAFAMAKETKEFIRVLKCGSALWQVDSTDLFQAATLARCFGRWKAGRGEGRLSFIMASEQHLGQVKAPEEPSQGQLRKHELVCPMDIQLGREIKQRLQYENHQSVSVWLCTGFLWLFLFSCFTH